MLRAQLEFTSQKIKEIFRRKQRVEDVCGQNRVIERLEHRAKYRGLAASDFARHNDDAFAVFYAVLQIGKYFQQAFSSKQVLWVRGQAERYVAQSVKLLIHSLFRLPFTCFKLPMALSFY